MAKGSQSPRLLILGGMGYFGARLTEKLSQNFDVTVTSRVLSPERERWLKSLRNTVKHLSYDSAKHTALPITQEFDYLVNLATPGSQECRANFENSRKMALNNIAACSRLLTEGRIQKLIHFSTFHVYGNSPTGIYREDMARNPNNPYGRVHEAVENWLIENAQTLAVSVLRPTNGVGAPAHADLGVQAHLLFLDCCRETVEKGQIQLSSDGNAYRDFVPLPDFISAVSLLLNSTSRSLSFYNMASGAVRTLRDLASRIQSQASEFLHHPISLKLGTQSDPLAAPFEIDTEKLKGLGWSPQIKLNEEIVRTLNFFMLLQKGIAPTIETVSFTNL